MTAPPLSNLVANFNQFRLESHVKRAIEQAWVLAKGQPLSAAHLLGAALLVARTERSAAFAKLAELLPLQNVAEPQKVDVPPLDLAAIPLTDSMADAFSVAEQFLADQMTVWGRDYVTLALSAKDPSLEEIAREAGSELSLIRHAWLDFVSASDQRRAPASWHEWWKAAEAALPREARESSTPVPFDLEGLDLSAGASSILSGVATRIGGGARSGIVSTSAVLLEMAEHGAPGPDPQWIADFLRQAVADYPSGYEAVIDRYWGGRIERKRVPSAQRSSQQGAASLMTQGLAWSLNRAQEIASQTTGTARICGRHLLTALIIDPPSPHTLGAIRRLTEIGIDVPLFRQRLYEWVRGYGDDDTAWRALLIAGGTQAWRRAEFDADGTTGKDLLGIEQDVLALATLIAARDSSPPLSIGLFGDWGSGKTFFMRQLRRTVGQLSDEARMARVMQRELPFYKHIVQIEFNAWHYVEGNLWASMVEHILENLRISDEQPTTVTERLQKHWINRLGFAEQAKAAADQKRDEAAAKVDSAKAAVEAAQVAHDEKKRELQRLSRKSAARDFQLSGALPVIAKSLEPLGLKPLSDAVTELQSSLRQARTIIERGNAVLTPLLRADDRSHRWRSLLIILIGAPVAAAGIGFLLTALGADRIAQISALATGAAGLLAGGAKWIRKQGEWMSQQLTNIEQAQRVYDDALQKALADMADQTAKTEEELALARQEYLLAQQRAEQARREQDAARADLAAATTSKLLGQFIQDRAASTDYRKHLGVLAIVRQDFQQLSQLIEEENWRLSSDGADDARFAGRLDKITSLDQEATDAETRINRIVLYIDDLDRCPPAKVVDVLQAVHLLLAFPLFVVVVGVDARWIARSLETRYRELLHVGNVDGANDVAQMFGVARSEDYLEKIFQIPLWLRTMDASAARRMVQGLLRKAAVPSAAATSAERQAVDLESAHPAGGPRRGGASDSSTGAGQQTGVGAQSTGLATASGLAAPAATATARAAPPRVAPNLESLHIRDFELSAIDGLSPLLGRSPRALKRFVNLYRLIKAGLTATEHDAFVRQNENGLSDYAAVLFLLAVDTGLPRVSRAVFDALLAANLDGRTDAMDVKALVKELDRDAAAKTAHWAALKAWITSRQESKTFDLGGIRKLAYWVPRVSRYSFQAVHLEAIRDAPLRRKAARKAPE